MGDGVDALGLAPRTIRAGWCRARAGNRSARRDGRSSGSSAGASRTRRSTAGEALLDRVGPLLAGLDVALSCLPDREAHPAGLLRITCTVEFRATVVAELVSRILACHPLVRVEVCCSNQEGLWDLLLICGSSIDLIGSARETAAGAARAGSDPGARCALGRCLRSLRRSASVRRSSSIRSGSMSKTR
jgi:hypothetical protein